MNLLSLWPGRNGRALIEDIGFLLRESDDEYRSKSADYLDAEQLDDFRQDAFVFHKRLRGLLPQRESDNGRIDRAAAVRILCGGQRYEAEFAIGGPVNPHTGEPYSKYSSEFQQWAKQQDKPALTHEQAELIEQLDFGVRAHPAARDLLAQGVSHGVVRCRYRDLLCQARLDHVNPQRGIVALTVCDGLRWLESTLRYQGPAHALAFQRAVLGGVTGKLVPVHTIAVEKHPPHRCGVWHVSRRLLRQVRRERAGRRVPALRPGVRQPGNHRLRCRGELFSAWSDRVLPDLRDRLIVESTQSGGRHVVYRCEAEICGNLKLAQRKDGDTVVTLIETRGEGGLFLCAPTAGYEITQGDLRDPPVRTEAERDVLLQAAWQLNQYVPPVCDGPIAEQASATAAVNGSPSADRPGDDYNSRG